jgi:hypothetical protein
MLEFKNISYRLLFLNMILYFVKHITTIKTIDNVQF